VPSDPDQNTPQHAQTILENLWGRDEVQFTSGLVAEKNGNVQWKNVRFPSLQMYEGRIHGGKGNKLFFTVVPDFKNNEFGVEEAHTAGGEGQDFGLSVSNVLRDRIYSFRSERLNLGVHQVGPIKVLAPNAGNLAQVLNNLQSNSYRFARFNELVREIFPSVLQVNVKQISDSLAEIFVWNEDPRTEREDLAIELKESGTGVGQVELLSILVFGQQSSGDSVWLLKFFSVHKWSPFDHFCEIGKPA